MIILLLGLFHLFHCPMLIFIPFWINDSYRVDIIYILYFFLIMFIYTFLNGECPISYISKKILEPHYIAGTDITSYIEMKYIISNDMIIQYYFGLTTILYLLTLGFVIYRANIMCFILSIPFFIIGIYFLLIRKIINTTKKRFLLFQEITKYVILLTMYILILL